MKLISKFTLWYILVTTIVLLIGGFILFKAILYEVDHEAEVKLSLWVKLTARELKQGKSVEELDRADNIIVEELDFDEPLVPYTKTDSTGLFPPKFFGLDRKLTIKQSFKIESRHFLITAFSFIAEPDEIIQGLEKSLSAIFIILLIFIGIVSVIISRQILAPFKQALQSIKSFNIKQQKPIELPETRTTEFKELNHFLGKMTQKALSDYRTLKEFSENASHEIRTPLAVIRGKVELLMSTGINSEQAEYINSIQNSVQKLSSINQSLLLLTKLENQEYQPSGKINFSELTENVVSSFQELMDMKSLKLTTQIEEGIHVLINPYLADILLSNLISNSIRHNYKKGTIFIQLDKEKLRIENTGTPPEIPVEEFFKRFKKSNQSSDSTGLGLSIVKQICDLNRLSISYTYDNNLHSIQINF